MAGLRFPSKYDEERRKIIEQREEAEFQRKMKQLKNEGRALRKTEKDQLKSITEVTPENLEKIASFVRIGVSSQQVYGFLQESLKKDKQVISLCIKCTNKANVLFLFKKLNEEAGVTANEYAKQLNEYHPEILINFVRKNKISPKLMGKFAKNNPDLYPMMLRSTLYTQEEKDIFFGETDRWKKGKTAVQYITLGKKIEFKDRSDYIKLVDAYIKGGKPLKAFCAKYEVPKDEFQEVLKIISEEDPERGREIAKATEVSTQKYVSVMRELVSKVLSGETTIDEVIDASKGRTTAWDFLNYMTYFDKSVNKELTGKMIQQIEYDDDFPNKSRIAANYGVKRFPSDQLVKWFDTGKHEPVKNIGEGISMLKHKSVYYACKAKEINQVHVLLRKMDWFKGEFDEKRLISYYVTSHFGAFQHKITKKDCEDALMVLKANDMMLSHQGAIEVIKGIIIGDITDSEINEAYEKVKTKELRARGKREKREAQFAEDTKDVKSVEDYIKCLSTRVVDNREVPLQGQNKDE